jgi:tetratricopeptide (TPR) repeat protein
VLRVKVLDRPAEEFEVGWANVARVQVYEELLLEEARRLTAAGNFDEAYDYFARLATDYPSLPGVKEALDDYLRLNSLALYRAKEHEHALALLLTLYQRNPNAEGLSGAVETVLSQLIERYLREGNTAAARGMLELWQNQLGKAAANAAANWQRRFESAATRQLNEATRLAQGKNYIAARKAVTRAIGIWPKLEAAPRVLAQIQQEFPFVAVGVLETAPHEPQRRIDSWAALRTGQLLHSLLAEEVDFGTEGGVYHSPFGEFQIDESGRELTLGAMQRLAPDVLSRYLLAVAKPGSPYYREDFAHLLTGVSIEPSTVRLRLRHVHVRPEALLQIPPPVANPKFLITDHKPEQVVFAPIRTRGAPTASQTIVETPFADDEQALAALVAGDIDVLDRVPPWHLARLSEVEDLRVESYRLPTVHVLIPNMKRPLLAKREFRRALCFGIDRQWILKRVLLGGKPTPGFEVVSGPFPAGASLSDPVRYGYNNRLTPRPFEPRLAAILSTIAWNSLQKPVAENEPAPELPPIPQLTLAHPNDPVVRIACQSIQMQLSRAGINVKLREFSADELLAGSLDCDLRYAELAVWEPLTDARRLLGPGGLAAEARSPHVDAALRELDKATNWNDVRSRLAELHDIVHHELPIIPLWQTINYFAYRTTMRGIGESPVLLYQNVNDWSPAAPGNVAQLGPRSP